MNCLLAAVSLLAVISAEPVQAYALDPSNPWAPEVAFTGNVVGFLPAGGEADLPTNLVIRYPLAAISAGRGLLAISDRNGVVVEQELFLREDHTHRPRDPERAPAVPRDGALGFSPLQLDLAPDENHRFQFVVNESFIFDEPFQTGPGPDETPPRIGGLAAASVPEEIWFCDFQPCPRADAMTELRWSASDDIGLALFEIWQKDDAGQWGLVGRRPASLGQSHTLLLRNDRELELKVTAVDWANHRTDSPVLRHWPQVTLTVPGTGCQGTGMARTPAGVGFLALGSLALLATRRRRS